MAEFTIRITGAPPPPLKKPRGGKKASAAPQQRYNLRLSPTTSLTELENNVFALFNVAASNRAKYSMEFLTGFPPTLLSKEGRETVDELGIRANETVIVKIALVDSGTAAAAAASPVKRTKQSTKSGDDNSDQDPTTAVSTGRPRRAAAEAATSSFKDVIQAQEAMMKVEKTKSSSNRRITTTNNIASLNKKPSPRKVKIEGVGYRLSDSKAVQGSSPSKRSRTHATSATQPIFSSKDDVATTLLSSMSGRKGNVGNFLRSAMKGAVLKSYEVSRAQVRVSAVENGDYKLERVKGGSIVDGGVVLGTASESNENSLGRTMYQVSYGKGIEGRGQFSEQVEIIGLDALKSTIKMVYNSKTSNDEEGDATDGREMLRPAAIAQMSPRMFWSLVYHCTSNVPRPQSVESMLREMMPEFDWTHLDRGGRKRALSEKAKENLRQEKRATQPADGQDEVRALEEIEDTIMNGLDGQNGDDLRRKRLEALSRLDPGNSAVDNEWKLITPTEEDKDEIIECIRAKNDDVGEEVANNYASLIMSSEQPCCRNWRELANADLDALTAKFTANTTRLDPEFILSWIDAAQERSIEEIMLEILDSDQDAFELLSEKANSANPWDLYQWQSYPQLLLDSLESTAYSVNDATRWISRANTALQTCAWLEDYSTSIV